MSYKTVIEATTGLVNWWRLNEASGTEAKAAFGPNVGTYEKNTGGAFTLAQPALVQTEGATPKSVRLEGTGEGNTKDAYVTLKNEIMRGSTTLVSIECWINIQALPKTSAFIVDNQNQSTGKAGWLLALPSTGKLEFRATSAAAANVGAMTKAAVSTKVRHHVVATFDGSLAEAARIKIYVDGVAVETEALAAGYPGTEMTFDASTGIPSRIGAAEGTFKTLGYNGFIEDVAYYKVALTEAVVKEHFEAGAAKAVGAILLGGTAKGTASRLSGKAEGSLLLAGTSKGTASRLSGAASGVVLLTGAAKGTAANVVSAKATGAMLLTGVSSGKTAGAVAGKASGALTLTGTAKALLIAVVSAKATGTLLLTGTAQGNAAGVVHGSASGVLFLTGTAQGTLRAVVSGKAAGPLILTGTATGQQVQVVVGSATGTLLLTGAASGLAFGPVTGSATGTLRFTGRGHIVGKSRGLPALTGPSEIEGKTEPLSGRIVP